MSGNTIVNYAVAIVVGIVVAVATAGTGLAAYSTLLGTIAFSATAGAMSYYNRPGMPGLNNGRGMRGGGGSSVKDAAAGQLEMTSASESVTAPVVFGTVRLPGNIVRFDRDTFHNKPIIQRYKIEQPVMTGGGSSGGKGGGGGGSPAKAKTKTTYQEQIVGYRYYLSFDIALTVGPIDAILAIASSPGELQVGTGGTFSGDTQTVTLDGPDEGGTVRLYRGSATQTRIPGDHYSDSDSNHRNFAFAHFQDFFIGTAPAPRTYLFTLRRLPKCLGLDGLPVPGLKTRGSANTSHPCYQDANPAAILYEIFTNTLWGRGMSPSLLDIDSFVAASAYFEAQNIGLSFTIDTANAVSETVDQIRSHCATIVVWNGEKLRCRCLLDRSTEYRRTWTISDDMASEVTFSRPAWPEVPNEIRVTFINRRNNFQAEIAHVQDVASYNTIGFMNSQSLQLLGFSNRSTAEAQAKRILGEMSYPRATLTFKCNSWQGQLEPGDLIRFVWREWSDGIATAFFRVLEVDDKQQDAQGLRITALEDLLLSPSETDDETITPSAPVFEDDVANDDADLALGDDHTTPPTIGSPQPLRVWEQPPLLSSGDADVIFTCRKPASFATAMLHRWTLTASIDFQLHSASSGWAIPGTIITPPPNTGRLICREASDAFTFALADTADGTSLLASANKVLLDGDDLANLSDAGTDLLLIGHEIFLVGKIEETSPGVFQATNYLRAAFGSILETHATGDAFAFIEEWSRPEFAASLGDIPIGEPITLRSTTVTIRGEDATSYDFTGPEADGSFTGRSAAPYPPEPYSASAVGLTFTVAVRPRFADRGAWVESDLATDCNNLTTTIPDSYALTVEPLNSGGTSLAGASAVAATWTPADGQSPATGLLAFSFTGPSGTAKLRIRANANGISSIDAIDVTP